MVRAGTPPGDCDARAAPPGSDPVAHERDKPVDAVAERRNNQDGEVDGLASDHEIGHERGDAGQSRDEHQGERACRFGGRVRRMGQDDALVEWRRDELPRTAHERGCASHVQSRSSCFQTSPGCVASGSGVSAAEPRRAT